MIELIKHHRWSQYFFLFTTKTQHFGGLEGGQCWWKENKLNRAQISILNFSHINYECHIIPFLFLEGYQVHIVKSNVNTCTKASGFFSLAIAICSVNKLMRLLKLKKLSRPHADTKKTHPPVRNTKQLMLVFFHGHFVGIKVLKNKCQTQLLFHYIQTYLMCQKPLKLSILRCCKFCLLEYNWTDIGQIQLLPPQLKTFGLIFGWTRYKACISLAHTCHLGPQSVF